MSKNLKQNRIVVMMGDTETDAIEDWMFANRIKSRSEAIRHMCKRFLTDEKEKAK